MGQVCFWEKREMGVARGKLLGESISLTWFGTISLEAWLFLAQNLPLVIGRSFDRWMTSGPRSQTKWRPFESVHLRQNTGIDFD